MNTQEYLDIGVQEAIALSTVAMGIRRDIGTASTYVKSRYLSEVGTVEVTDVSAYKLEQCSLWDRTALLDETKDR
jgi:hypothetical protein